MLGKSNTTTVYLCPKESIVGKIKKGAWTTDGPKRFSENGQEYMFYDEDNQELALIIHDLIKVSYTKNWIAGNYKKTKTSSRCTIEYLDSQWYLAHTTNAEKVHL